MKRYINATQNRAKGPRLQGGEPNSERWNMQDGFRIVLKTTILGEIELAGYFRGKGVYVG
jgi:hypothetical protein